MQIQKAKQGYKLVKSYFGKHEEIPEEWKLEEARNIFKFTMGQSPPSESYNQSGQGLPFYQGVTDFGVIHPKPTVWCSDPRKTAKESEILFSVRAPVGETNITESECCLGRGVASLNSQKNDLFYCFYLVTYNKKRFSIYSQGTTYDAINKDEIGKTKLPFTNNKLEQQKIASILSNVDSLIQQTQKIIEQTQRLKKGLMQTLLTMGIKHTKFKKTKIGEIPEQWDIVKLKDVTSIRYGLSQPPELDKNGISMIRATDIKNGVIIEHKPIKIKLSSVPKSRIIFLKSGDIIVVRSGVFTGDVALVTREFDGAIAGYDLVVSPFNRIVPLFLCNYLLSPIVQNYFLSLKGRSAQSHLNAQQLAEINIALPEISEQQKIASIISDMNSEINHEQNQKSKLEILKKGLMQKLLTGQIRVNV